MKRSLSPAHRAAGEGENHDAPCHYRHHRHHHHPHGHLYHQVFKGFLLMVTVSALLAGTCGHYFFSDFAAGGARAWRLLPALLLLLLLLSMGSYRLARRITRRLETLQAGVERFGAGELGSRVPVQGHDEVAELAQAFNGAATQIEALVQQQQRMLASASHELRAPLSRLRMALSLVLDVDNLPSAERRAALLSDAEHDIEELDALVDDVLLAARLQAPTGGQPFTAVDLDALVTELAARSGASVTGSGGQVMGDPKMLRRLVRNLLDNAGRHGRGGEVSVELSRAGDGGPVLRVCDRGPGVPEADRERIFEAFYRPQGHAETRDGGVGLGLSLVRQIAEHHGGSVRYLPRDGGGSCFEVSLAPAPGSPGRREDRRDQARAAGG